MATPHSNGDAATEIVFFDLETTVPRRAGQRFWVLEFGAIVVCPRKLVELESYCTLIRPGDLSAVALRSRRCDGITRQTVATAPMFEDVADRIFGILNGRVWAGHNIQRFDSARIKEAFVDIGRSAPVPVGMIDSLGILTQKFGRRAGNMKMCSWMNVTRNVLWSSDSKTQQGFQMATLAAYFGLGQQKHRSLDDVRMNFEVLKNCATVLFLESSLPDVLGSNSKPQGFTTVTTRSSSLRSSYGGEETNRKSPPIPIVHQRRVPYANGRFGKVTDGVKNLICRVHKNQPLALGNFLKASHFLLR